MTNIFSIACIFSKKLHETINGETVAQAVKKTNGRLTVKEMQGLLDGKYIPTTVTLCDIADAYGVSTDYLLGRTEEKEPAQAEAGQAQKTNYKSSNNNIAQSEEVVKSLEPFLSLAVAMAKRKHEEITVTITDSNWNKWMMRIRKLDKEYNPC